MVNMNTVSEAAVMQNVRPAGSNAEAQKPAASRTPDAQASSVVNLQTQVAARSESAPVKVDASNAQSMANDIAALLGQLGGGSQANLNGFDAARLLAS